MMSHHQVTCVDIFLMVCLGLTYFPNAQGLSYGCPPITLEDLGSTSELSTEGLIARSIYYPYGRYPIPSRISRYAVLCDSSGNRRNTSSSVSVLVEYRCRVRFPAGRLAHCDGNTNSTWQFCYRCESGDVWSLCPLAAFKEPTAQFTTAAKNRCRLCTDPQSAGGLLEYDRDTQCLGKCHIIITGVHSFLISQCFVHFNHRMWPLQY